MQYILYKVSVNYITITIYWLCLFSNATRTGQGAPFGSRPQSLSNIVYYVHLLYFLSNKESITKSVFSHTKHLQINNLHISTIVFHFRHILFLHDLLIHLFFPFHMSDHHLAKGLSLSSVPPDTRNSSSLPLFRSRLKTHLFKIAFPP